MTRFPAPKIRKQFSDIFPAFLLQQFRQSAAPGENCRSSSPIFRPVSRMHVIRGRIAEPWFIRKKSLYHCAELFLVTLIMLFIYDLNEAVHAVPVNRIHIVLRPFLPAVSG